MQSVRFRRLQMRSSRDIPQPNILKDLIGSLGCESVKKCVRLQVNMWMKVVESVEGLSRFMYLTLCLSFWTAVQLRATCPTSRSSRGALAARRNAEFRWIAVT